MTHEEENKILREACKKALARQFDVYLRGPTEYVWVDILEKALEKVKPKPTKMIMREAIEGRIECGGL